MLTYDDLVKGDMTLKTDRELVQQGINLDWWPTLQLESRFAKDKSRGIYTQPNPSDKLLFETDDKLIMKLLSIFVVDKNGR